MIKWFLDKDNKVPLYLQLKDQIKYYISTGALESNEQLPPVKMLAKELEINFQTVRKAYFELEKDGLIIIKHGEGTFISLNGSGTNQVKPEKNNQIPESFDFDGQFANETENLIKQYLQQGLDFAKAREIVEKTFEKIEKNNAASIVIFAECNQFQVKQISELLCDELKTDVKPIMLNDLKWQLGNFMKEGKDIFVITTGFHVNEVRQAVGEFPVQIDILITNLNPETRRKLEAVGEKANYGFICRDQESAVLYKDLLKAELGFNQINLTSCTIAETEKVQNILETAEVILTSPPVYEEVKKIAGLTKPVFNLFERVDPMSLKVTKDRVLGKAVNTQY